MRCASPLDPLAHPDLLTVAKSVPHGVLCLISAHWFHELTTQVPHTIDVALRRGKTKPRLDYPPTRFFWFSPPAFHEGMETHEPDGVPVRTWSWRGCGSGTSAARSLTFS